MAIQPEELKQAIERGNFTAKDKFTLGLMLVDLMHDDYRQKMRTELERHFPWLQEPGEMTLEEFYKRVLRMYRSAGGDCTELDIRAGVVNLQEKWKPRGKRPWK